MAVDRVAHAVNEIIAKMEEMLLTPDESMAVILTTLSAMAHTLQLPLVVIQELVADSYKNTSIRKRKITSHKRPRLNMQ